MTGGVSQFLITRFNLPSRGHESLIRAQENWLRERVALFERYCLPSVLQQTCDDVTWIIYFDPDSPGWLHDWIAMHVSAGHFVALFRTEVSQTELLADLRAAAGEMTGGTLVTSNLDNDDGIAIDFVARVRGQVRAGERMAIYLSEGLIRQGSALYRFSYPHNPFCSVAEPWEGARTCWADWHNLLGHHMPVTVDAGAPGWLQVVHGRNVSNRARGDRVDPSAYLGGFSGILDDLPPLTRAELIRERLLSAPSRKLRETARAGAKKTIAWVGGKEGLDRAKALRSRIVGLLIR